MLSADDDIRRNAAQNMMQGAAAMPGVFDPYYVARFYAGTIRGVDPDKAVPPPQPPQAPPPKMSIAVAVKWPELPSEAQLALLEGAGMHPTPALTEELQLQDTMKGIVTADQAATAADALLSPAPSAQQAQQQDAEQQGQAADRAQTAASALADRELKAQELKIKDKVASKPRTNGRA